MAELTAGEINRLFPVRTVEDYNVQTPHPAQQVALSLNQKELLYGGAAGGGKSSYLLMAALQYVDIPGYSALILRRTWPDLNSPSAILDRFKDWMAGKNVHKGEMGRLWTFPSGAKIQFGYAQREDAKYKFQGAEYQFVGFDEGTQFEPEIYKYLISRLRRPEIPCLICTSPVTRYYDGEGHVRYRHKESQPACPGVLPDPVSLQQYTAAPDGTTIFDVPLRMRVTANPGGLSHEFFKERFIDEETRRKDAVFIPAALKDNPSLNRAEYAETLAMLSPVDRERLLNGDWEVMDSGNMFDRGAFEYLDEPPAPHEVKARVRFWDFAASDTKKSDWTAGVLVSVCHDGRWVIEDIVHIRKLAPDVEKIVRETAIKDGIGVPIWAEQEPGASGKAYISYLKRVILAGFQFNGERSTGNKKDRAKAMASQSQAQNVFLVKASWNKDFLDEASLFPASKFDDQIDASSAGFNKINFSRKPLRLIL